MPVLLTASRKRAKRDTVTGTAMALTETFIKLARDKHGDSGSIPLLMKEAGKYWNLNYRYMDKHKTLPPGIYPAVSRASADRCEDARKLLAEGICSEQAKRHNPHAKTGVVANTFETVTRSWLTKAFR